MLSCTEGTTKYNGTQKEQGEEGAPPCHAQLPSRVSRDMGYERGGAWRGSFVDWREESIIGHKALDGSEGRDQTRERQQARIVGEPSKKVGREKKEQKGKGKRERPPYTVFLGLLLDRKGKDGIKSAFSPVLSDFLSLCVAILSSSADFIGFSVVL